MIDNNNKSNKTLRSKFLRYIVGIILLSTCALSTLIAIVEGVSEKANLREKGLSFASYIAKLGMDPLIMNDTIQLDSIVHEINRDEDIFYAIVRNAKGEIVTSQYASVNFKSPRLKSILSEVTRDSSISDIVELIKNRSSVIEVSVPIVSGTDTIGMVNICLSEYLVNRNILLSILFIFGFNGIAAGTMVTVLYKVSNRILFDPISSLAHAADQLATGDMSTRIKTEAVGEVQMLCDSFNRMAEQLDKTTVSKDFVDNIIGSMTETLIILTPELTIKDVNSAALKLLGYDREELTGRPVDMIVDPAFLVCHARAGQKFSGVSDTVLSGRDGRNIPVIFSVSPIITADNDVQGYVCVARDLSDIKQAERVLALQAQELARSNAELEKFAYVASHDLQEPLRKVTAFGDRLQDKYGAVLGEQGLDYLTRMRNAASRMQVLINDLLAFSRITTKAQPFIQVDLTRVAEEVISDLEIKIEQTSGVVRLGNLPVMDADPLQIRQLFQNLIGNALKFHKPDIPPLVIIDASSMDDKLSRGGEECFYLNIRDNGIGFEEKYADRIFEVFQRLHGRTEYEGTGIGLAICRKIVERHAGSIVARSTPGEGSEFIIQLPYRQKGEPTYGVAA